MNKRDCLRKNAFSRWIYDRARSVYYFHVRVFFEEIRDKWNRYKDNYIPEIRSLKDTHAGERCFIVCTGPSLTINDLERIKNEYCLSMNSAIKIFDKTNWRPMYYGIQDEHVYEKMSDEVLRLQCEYIFIGDKVVQKGYAIPDSAIVYRDFREGISVDNPYPPIKFSDDSSIVIYDGFSITYSLLQLACYMGFKEIYLLGCDCSFSRDPEKQHFVNSGHVDVNAYRIGEKMIMAFEKAKEYCDSHGIKVYNATRGGALEVFPRVNLDEMDLK